MKTELKAKFLQHLIQKRENKGFTLIELLVVIVIIGILSAIALPSFLNQANKARQTEAKTYVGSINRGQQAYYVEYARFGEQTEVEASVPDTQNYKYAVAGTPAGDLDETTTITGTAQKANLKSYAGYVIATANDLPGIVCETVDPSETAPTPTGITFDAGRPAPVDGDCGADAALVGQ
ncbi:type IV pilin protein [Vacuolonema iberomarrocanum]|uniref:type IV pilin protein n=1 Tax=Vacuolonema iberomarrocanum TaxID=3454632 RepID=UPI001A08FE9C|nr:prepilin-type N-terminal cleavage/methylation domain-containing protein [filamentous cyanobacterium LEGE 07170]